MFPLSADRVCSSGVHFLLQRQAQFLDHFIDVRLLADERRGDDAAIAGELHVHAVLEQADLGR